MRLPPHTGAKRAGRTPTNGCSSSAEDAAAMNWSPVPCTLYGIDLPPLTIYYPWKAGNYIHSRRPIRSAREAPRRERRHRLLRLRHRVRTLRYFQGRNYCSGARSARPSHASASWARPANSSRSAVRPRSLRRPEPRD